MRLADKSPGVRILPRRRNDRDVPSRGAPGGSGPGRHRQGTASVSRSADCLVDGVLARWPSAYLGGPGPEIILRSCTPAGPCGNRDEIDQITSLAFSAMAKPLAAPSDRHDDIVVREPLGRRGARRPRTPCVADPEHPLPTDRRSLISAEKRNPVHPDLGHFSRSTERPRDHVTENSRTSPLGATSPTVTHLATSLPSRDFRCLGMGFGPPGPADRGTSAEPFRHFLARRPSLASAGFDGQVRLWSVADRSGTVSAVRRNRRPPSPGLPTRRRDPGGDRRRRPGPTLGSNGLLATLRFVKSAAPVPCRNATRSGAVDFGTASKKKELVGEFKNPGEEWQPKGEPVEVSVHDFPDKKLGKAIPYGV